MTTTSTALMDTYARLPIAFARGSGVYLFDEEGKRYLDALTGLAVAGLGHAHPRVTAAIAAQAESVMHTSNLYRIRAQEKLAERLVRISGMERAFFGNSGAEANECAIKLARIVGHQRDIKLPQVIVVENSFHGRTMGTLTATGSRKVQAGFEPLLAGFVRAPFDDVKAIEKIAANTDDVIAILVEPIQGEAGIIVPKAGYLTALRRICDERRWLLMLDEVQTGNGRTGRYFCYQHEGILPDVVTTAKGLANGVPIGVCLARGEAATAFHPGNHGSTFGGNPLACAAALAVLDVIDDERLLERAAALGDRMQARFRAALDGDNRVVDIRGKGLMLGIELATPCGDLVKRALAKGLLINVTHERVIRLLPPLIMSDADADRVADKVVTLIREFDAG